MNSNDVTDDSKTPLNILLVDDNEADVKIALRAFKQSHIKTNIYTVNDGDEAIQFIRNEGQFSDKAEFPRPDLMLLDINMPRMGGLEVLDEIKTYDEYRSIPVAMLTSSKNQKDIKESYTKGACSYIAKPVDYKEFAEIINSFNVYWSIVNRLPNIEEE